MKSKMDQNAGFTLVELVVAVAILGIVIAIALPTISNLQRNNETKKYTSYESSIVASSKLYIDSYEEDKFNKKDLTTQCAGITFDDLQGHNLLKKYDLDGVKCSGTGEDDIAAYVIKESSGKYKYYPTIICQKSNTKVYETKFTIPPVCKKVAEPVASIGENYCFSNSENAKINLKLNDSDVTSAQYALIESVNSNNQEAIRNLEYKDISGNVIDLSTVQQGRENKNYKVVLRYGYEGDFEYQYKVLSKTVSLNYASPKITIVAKKYNGTFKDSDLDKYSNYNNGSWTNTSVYVKASAKDGCNKKTAVILENQETSGANITDEGVHELSFTTNNGGSKSISIKIDKTPPTCSMKIEGTEGENEWYTSDVTIEGRCWDIGGSGCVYPLTSESKIKDNTSGKTVTETVWDRAGNKSTCSKTVKIDKSQLSCSIELDGPKGDYEWYKDSVKVTVKPVYDGLEGPSPVHYFLDTYDYGEDKFASNFYNDEEWWEEYETSGTIWYGYVKNEAGTTGKCDKIVKIDKTPPSCSITIDGTKGLDNWYTSSKVTLTLNKSDAVGEIAQYGIIAKSTATYNSKTEQTYVSDTTGITYYGYVKDKAGNTNSCNVWFKKDSTPPTCTNKGGSEAWTNKSRTISGTCRDSGSGCEKDSVKRYIDWEVNLTNLSPGTVKDNAGNETVCPYDQTVRIDKTPPQAVEKINLHYAKMNGTERYLFGYKFKDALSGLSESGNSFKYAYSTNDYDSFKDAYCGTTFEMSDLSDALYGFTIKDTSNGIFQAGVSVGCTNLSCVKSIKGQFNICDKAGNCTNTGVLDYYK